MVDVIVIGGGHAGVEAALACARLKKQTLLYTMHLDMIASMPCNPSIGGPAKGVVVREIDALGGEMGKAADATALQFKMLNTTKGPGVQSLRVQSDKIAYKTYMQHKVLHQDMLEVKEMCIEKLLLEKGAIKGVFQQDGTCVHCKVVIMTTGTYMSSHILIGHDARSSGPEDEPTTHTLSQFLRAVGMQTFRLKTGTPARVTTTSIDFSKTIKQPGTDALICFSSSTKQIRPFHKQMDCHLTYTTATTHKIIQDNLHASAMYSGFVKGVGPRYCPSIEDKLVRFADKKRHQIFLEPESELLPTTYVQGFSTSMPQDVQEAMVHSLPGLEHCHIEKYAYAIEYDAIDPLQCKVTLENKLVENLYTAGQINGTSGYEEAAAQGLMAGINACLKLDGKPACILHRDEAYIGVMIDDLVTKGTKEPYRLLTSRAEYRLLLRHDNAEHRLMKYGYTIGLVDKERYEAFVEREKKIEEVSTYMQSIRFTPKSPIHAQLTTFGYEQLKEGISAAALLKRPMITMDVVAPYLEKEIQPDIAKQVEIEIKYEGYIKKAKRDAARLRAMENVVLPTDLVYEDIENLSLEARQKLTSVQPITMGQASRISGVNPADIAVLAIFLEQHRRK